LTASFYIDLAGKSAWGIELSEAVLKSECPDLLKKKVCRHHRQYALRLDAWSDDDGALLTTVRLSQR
jgi:hypothetical protein